MVKNVLRRKLVRDMWHNRMQFLAVILLCALGTWVFSGLDAAWRMLDLSAQTYFDEQNVADIWITLSSADREAVERVRKMYPIGCRVELISMDDSYSSLTPGTKVTVRSVDDTGTVFVRWDNGSGLGVVYGVDRIRKL